MYSKWTSVRIFFFAFMLCSESWNRLELNLISADVGWMYERGGGGIQSIL
jgi:hypothetical protein